MSKQKETIIKDKDTLKEQLKDVLFEDQLSKYTDAELNQLLLTDDELVNLDKDSLFNLTKGYRKLVNELISNIYKCVLINDITDAELIDFVQLLLDAKVKEWMGVDLTNIKPKKDGTYEYTDLKRLSNEIFAKYSEAWDEEKSEDEKQTEV